MYKKTFITAKTVCKQGRAQYYATLQKAKKGRIGSHKAGCLC